MQSSFFLPQRTKVAVKTEISHQDFVYILSYYDLGAFIQASPITAGTVQTNYFLHTTQGKFVLRYYENRTKESVLFETDLLTYLKTHRYPCPTPLKNQQGNCVGIFHCKPYVLFEFMTGRHISHPNERQKQQLIQKVAELQSLTQQYQPRYMAHRWHYDVDLCRTLAQTKAKRINTKSAYKKLAWLENELAALDLPESHPKGICHCDFHFSNVLFQNDQFAALLDFDDANYTFLQFDLVGLIDSWAWPHTNDTLNMAEARRIVQTYMTCRPLSQMEQHHLFDVYKLSILFDCVWFFARGDADDFYEKRKIAFLKNVKGDLLNAKM